MSSKAIVIGKAKFKNDIKYYKIAKVVQGNKDIYGKHFTTVSYPYIRTAGESYVSQKAPTETSSVFWSTTATVLPYEEIDGFDVAYTLSFFRLNSNIYKNIFPEEVSDMEYINKIIDDMPNTSESVKQNNHGFAVGDVVYFDAATGVYQKALAENSDKAIVAGVVSKVKNSNIFTLMTTGIIEYQHLDYVDTSILYLSDKIPGKLVHYTAINNKIYIPIAIYADNKFIINIQQGTIGDELAPYEPEITNFDTYTMSELDDVINLIKGGVKHAI